MVELKLNLGLQVIGEYWSQIDLILRVELTWYWESNWLDIESRIDLILRVKLTWYWESNWLDIENRIDLILRVKLTWYWESNWLDIESWIDLILRVELTWYWESNWLDIESRTDLILRVELTWYWESIWLKYSPITRNLGSNFVPRVTHHFRSKWLHIFFQFISDAHRKLCFYGEQLKSCWRNSYNLFQFNEIILFSFIL